MLEESETKESKTEEKEETIGYREDGEFRFFDENGFSPENRRAIKECFSELKKINSEGGNKEDYTGRIERSLYHLQAGGSANMKAIENHLFRMNGNSYSCRSAQQYLEDKKALHEPHPDTPLSLAREKEEAPSNRSALKLYLRDLKPNNYSAIEECRSELQRNKTAYNKAVKELCKGAAFIKHKNDLVGINQTISRFEKRIKETPKLVQIKGMFLRSEKNRRLIARKGLLSDIKKRKKLKEKIIARLEKNLNEGQSIVIDVARGITEKPTKSELIQEHLDRMEEIMQEVSENRDNLKETMEGKTIACNKERRPIAIGGNSQDKSGRKNRVSR